MNCPKCKTKLSDNVIKCPTCGIRIGRYCPSCNTYNYITNKVCTKCSEILLLECPKCKSINLPSAKKCRKCGIEFSAENKKQSINEVSYEAKYQTLADSKRNILVAINSPSIKVVSVSGDNEYGKNYIFKGLMRETASLGIAWLMGKCTPHTQLTPLGYIQNVLLNLFNITNFCTDKKELKKESLKFFKKDFSDLSTNEIYDLLNILYPETEDVYQNIEKNEQKTIKIILKIFHTILSKMNTVLLVENIEYIDSFSYEILNILISDDYFSDKLTLIMSFAKEQSGKNCFVTPKLKESHYVDITVAPFTKEQIEPFFASSEFKITGDLKTKIIQYGKKNPVLTEQLINIVHDVKGENSKIKLFTNIDEILKYRLQLLKEDDNEAYLVLMIAAILGLKFSPILIDGTCGLTQETIETCILKLVKKNYIIPVTNSCYEFKTLSIWNAIIDIIQNDTNNFVQVNNSLFELLQNYTISTFALLAYISQNLEQIDTSINLWAKCASLVAYIGDKGLYIILLKQILSLLDKSQIENKNAYKQRIYSEVGKLLEGENPDIAFDYLTKATLMCNDTNIDCKIELLGYLASVSMKLKNYHGTIECIDKTLNLISENIPLDIAIIKSRKLRPLELLGNCGAIINMFDNEIITYLEKGLENPSLTKLITQDELFTIYVKTNIIYVKALALQGNKRVFDVLQMLADTCRANQIQDKDIWLDININYAFANTISGNIVTSVKILDEILSQEKISDKDMSFINLISILNRYFMNRTELSQDELFQATQFADDVDDEFTKNIIKMFLGCLIQERTNPKDAIRVFTEQVEYFANKQNAIGVLLGWYFIAKTKMVTDGADVALDIAQKALDITNAVSVDNFLFATLLQKVISEAYLIKQDYEAAKMYIEKAIQIAQNNNLKYQLVNLYLLYAKYFQEIAISAGDKKVDYVFSAKEMIKRASIISDSLKLSILSAKVNKSNRVLASFCQMNGIVLQSN